MQYVITIHVRAQNYPELMRKLAHDVSNSLNEVAEVANIHVEDVHDVMVDTNEIMLNDNGEPEKD